MFVPCDVTDFSQLQNLVDVTIARFGRIDCVINNALVVLFVLGPGSPLTPLVACSGAHPVPKTIDEFTIEEMESLSAYLAI
jgi:NAD(P)-dependent dehydrogenase (short-subunit alcohol dehydrogenase family)